MRNENLIKILYECIAECTHCADACLDEQDVKMMVECIRLDRICAAVCQATAVAVSTNSSTDLKNLVTCCEEICRTCAEECAKHEAQHCQDCAEVCKKCAEACASY